MTHEEGAIEVLARLYTVYGAKNDSDLARKMGKSTPSTVGSWRARGSVPYAECVNVASVKGVTLEWLLTGEGPMHREAQADDEARREMARETIKDMKRIALEDFEWVPFYDVQVAAGLGRIVSEPDTPPDAYNSYRRRYLSKRGLLAKHLIEVTVTGDSMEPELREGDTVLVDTSDKRLRGGKIFVFRQSEGLLVKYLQPLPGDRIQVISENREAYPPYLIEPRDIENGEIEIIGRVVRQGRDR